jgi:hypothetical protein
MLARTMPSRRRRRGTAAAIAAMRTTTVSVHAHRASVDSPKPPRALVYRRAHTRTGLTLARGTRRTTRRPSVSLAPEPQAAAAQADDDEEEKEEEEEEEEGDDDDDDATADRAEPPALVPAAVPAGASGTAPLPTLLGSRFYVQRQVVVGNSSCYLPEGAPRPTGHGPWLGRVGVRVRECGGHKVCMYVRASLSLCPFTCLTRAMACAERRRPDDPATHKWRVYVRGPPEVRGTLSLSLSPTLPLSLAAHVSVCVWG